MFSIHVSTERMNLASLEGFYRLEDFQAGL